MNSLSGIGLPAKYVQFNHGYTLYLSGKSITHCTNEQQRAGWRSAQKGASACALVDSVFARGGSARDADTALAAIA